MKIISHRGNLDYITKAEENNPKKIEYASSLGYDVEVDVWLLDNNFYLGHDEPQYLVDDLWLKSLPLWCHAKNNLALFALNKLGITYFWHEKDKYTITSNGLFWAYPGSPLNNKTIAVMPEITTYSQDDLKHCYGICTDNPNQYRKLLVNE